MVDFAKLNSEEGRSETQLMLEMEKEWQDESANRLLDNS